jgi:ferric-dicitrate binding protein FerR (iron transport regulator)
MHQEFENILQGKASNREKEEFYRKLEHDPGLKKDFIEFRKIRDLAQIKNRKVDSKRKKQLFNEFWKRTHQSRISPLRQAILPAARYAAVVLIASSAGFYLHSLMKQAPQIKEIHSEKGSISSIYLSDGSEIMLNANTSIQIKEGEKTTGVSLHGEAYFRIKHNPDREFIIDLGPMKVRDVGTEFNISAYPTDSIFRTTLIEGSIDLLDNKGKKIEALAQNETFCFNKNNADFGIEKIDPLLVTGWTDNKFVFINQPLSQIFKTFEQWYGAQIIIEDKDISNEVYTSVVRRTTNVKQMLDMFQLTTGIKYRIENKNDADIIYISK